MMTATAMTMTVTTMSFPRRLREQALDGAMTRAVAAMSSDRRWVVDDAARGGGADDARHRCRY